MTNYQANYSRTEFIYPQWTYEMESFVPYDYSLGTREYMGRNQYNCLPFQSSFANKTYQNMKNNISSSSTSFSSNENNWNQRSKSPETTFQDCNKFEESTSNLRCLNTNDISNYNNINKRNQYIPLEYNDSSLLRCIQDNKGNLTQTKNETNNSDGIIQGNENKRQIEDLWKENEELKRKNQILEKDFTQLNKTAQGFESFAKEVQNENTNLKSQHLSVVQENQSWTAMCDRLKIMLSQNFELHNDFSNVCDTPETRWNGNMEYYYNCEDEYFELINAYRNWLKNNVSQRNKRNSKDDILEDRDGNSNRDQLNSIGKLRRKKKEGETGTNSNNVNNCNQDKNNYNMMKSGNTINNTKGIYEGDATSHLKGNYDKNPFLGKIKRINKGNKGLTNGHMGDEMQTGMIGATNKANQFQKNSRDKHLNLNYWDYQDNNNNYNNKNDNNNLYRSTDEFQDNEQEEKQNNKGSYNYPGNCFACNLGCSVSQSGYSPMTFSPYDSKQRRRSYTPNKGGYAVTN